MKNLKLLFFLISGFLALNACQTVTTKIDKTTEQEKLRIEEETIKAEEVYEDHNKKLKTVQEKIMLAREKRASASAKSEGLQNRKRDLLERIESDLKLNEANLFNSGPTTITDRPE